MPFRTWFYLMKIGVPIVFAILLATFTAGSDSWLRGIHNFACVVAVLLAITGSFMGTLMIFGKLQMLCPFCGQSGTAGGNKRDGLCMYCEACGFIHSSGFLGLKIIREKLNDE